MNFSRLVLLVHRWAGLASCAFLFVIAITGVVLVYADPIDRALTPALRRIEPQGARQPLAATRSQRGSNIWKTNRIIAGIMTIPSQPTISPGCGTSLASRSGVCEHVAIRDLARQAYFRGSAPWSLP